MIQIDWTSQDERGEPKPPRQELPYPRCCTVWSPGETQTSTSGLASVIALLPRSCSKTFQKDTGRPHRQGHHHWKIASLSKETRTELGLLGGPLGIVWPLYMGFCDVRCEPYATSYFLGHGRLGLNHRSCLGTWRH